jgi:hypothetical protein
MFSWASSHIIIPKKNQYNHPPPVGAVASSHRDLPLLFDHLPVPKVFVE